MTSASKKFRLPNCCKLEAIEVPLDARTRGSVIAKMTELAARTHLLWDPAKMAEAVRAREEMHSTALDNGVALLHPRRPMPAILAEAVLALGITPGGIPFGSGGSLTDIFFLICSTSDHEHLRILARLSRVINDQDFSGAMRAAEDAAALHQLDSTTAKRRFARHERAELDELPRETDSRRRQPCNSSAMSSIRTSAMRSRLLARRTAESQLRTRRRPN